MKIKLVPEDINSLIPRIKEFEGKTAQVSEHYTHLSKWCLDSLRDTKIPYYGDPMKYLDTWPYSVNLYFPPSITTQSLILAIKAAKETKQKSLSDVDAVILQGLYTILDASEKTYIKKFFAKMTEDVDKEIEEVKAKAAEEVALYKPVKVVQITPPSKTWIQRLLHWCGHG